MRLHRFYTTEKIDEKNPFTINSAELVNQVRRVFRLREGDSVILFTGTQIDYECKIDDYDTESTIVSDKSIRLQVTSMKRSRYSPQQRIFLCAAITKKDTFEWIVEKATELGVTDIVPVIAERSEKKSLSDLRLKKISVEASEQSGRGSIPMIHPIIGLVDVDDFFKNLNEKDLQKIVFHTEGERLSMSNIDKSKPVAVFIGPEGGWSPKELEMFHEKNISVKCLGDQVLRSETAVIATLSQLVFGK